MPALTPSQTIGPFFDRRLLGDELRVLAGPGTRGQRVRLEGRVTDGDTAPVADAVVEVWQANAAGRYRHPADNRDVALDPAFVGWGRCPTDDHGGYWFETVKPGPVTHDAGLMAPHVNLTIFARGLLRALSTRVYFADEAANAQDPVLALAPPQRRATLVAQPVPSASLPTYRLDLVLQGDAALETVYLAL